jgi:drug/metabolite transporter (DMT)-like permease
VTARRSTFLPTLALVAVTAAWGSTFPLIKDIVATVPVPDFLFVRFTVAALALVAIQPRAVARLSPAARRHGVVLGLVYGVAQVLQTYGLAHTAASVSGFITGMYVVLTPLFGALFLRQRIGASTWAAVALATVGLALLSLDGIAVGDSGGLGEALTLLAAALYAVHILGLGAWSTPQDAIGLSVVQMAVIAAVCGAGAVPGGVTLPSDPGQWAAVLYTGLIAGALALVAQTWAQAHLPATRAAIVMTLEPAFAALFAVLLGGETLTVRLLFGGALVLAAMYLAELGPRRARDAGVPHLAG